jgi:hypothetical protein
MMYLQHSTVINALFGVFINLLINITITNNKKPNDYDVVLSKFAKVIITKFFWG